MKVAIYCRVSTDEQSKNGYSIDAQLSDIKTYCKLRKWDVYKEYIDRGYTGRNDKRPSYQDMISSIDKFDMIVCHKLDRIHRNLYNSLKMLRLLDEQNIGFCSVSQSIDTSSSFGSFFFNVINAIAELESDLISERTMKGMYQKALSGKRVGGAIPYGYRLKNGKLLVNLNETMVIKRVYQMYVELGKTMNEICSKLNSEKHCKKFYPKTIKCILSNPVYCGYHRYKDLDYPGEHQSLISVETFNKAVEIIKRRRGKARKIEVK
ncbi:MAG: recombinase family protein [Candidatus Thermoplasmatota archaeon]|nr:recombinase family protein [Candidatus Thermoplasmatota archaeon]